jgi:hypothetical protein
MLISLHHILSALPSIFKRGKYLLSDDIQLFSLFMSHGSCLVYNVMHV